MFCAKCGAKILNNDQFCGKCGAIVEQQNHSARIYLICSLGGLFGGMVLAAILVLSGITESWFPTLYGISQTDEALQSDYLYEEVDE